MWPKFPSLQGKKRIFALVAIALMVGASIVAVVSTVGAGVLGPRNSSHPYAVNFTVTGNEQQIDAGRLAYDQDKLFAVNVTDERVTALVGRLEWQDQGNTPLRDPYVDLIITYQANPDLWSANELPAPGGIVEVKVPNEIPKNVTLSASSESEAIARASSGVNSTTQGQGEWTVRLTTQSPTFTRPYIGGEISYTLWVSIYTYEGAAKQV